jgi:hypothetical protein
VTSADLPRENVLDVLRALPRRVVDRARALLDSALDRVFDEPYDVRSAEELERLAMEAPAGIGPGVSATSVGAFVAAATPFARRAAGIALRSARVAERTPSPWSRVARVGVGVAPVAAQLTTTARRGIRELQLLASYVIARARAAGIEPERGFVRALTMSLAIDPARRPDLDSSGRQATAGITRQWVRRSVGSDGEEDVRTRVRRQAEALDRLDLPALADDWQHRRAQRS